MKLIRADLYGGYVGEHRPDPDHCYIWKQESYETSTEFADRISSYIHDIVEQLAEDEGGE